MEVYVLVARKRSMAVQMSACLCLALAIAMMLMSCSYPALLAFSILGIVGWVLLQFHTFKEYEYSYFDGEIRFARIMNKSRRKRLKTFSMDEVITVAPSEDRSVSNYMRDDSIRKIDYTSGNKETPYYVIVTKNNEAITMIKFEPDEAFLDALSIKYRQKLVRRAVTETAKPDSAE